MGKGSEKNNLMKYVKKKDINVKFLDHQPPKIAKAIISQADLGLVTLTKKMYRLAYPSKIMTYLQQGIPIISTIEKDSELIKDMLSLKYGYWIPRGDNKKLSQLLNKLISNKSWKYKMKKNVKKAYKEKFCSRKILANWKYIIDQT